MIVRSLQKREQAKDSSEFGETETVKHCSEFAETGTGEMICLR
jgi:hypothetical protein